jgi:uncharacterized damage-inducible protein DinB
MRKNYRKGGVGAMMDEYERAAWEIKDLIGRISKEDFVRIVDSETKDESCRSAQTIMSHVVRAGYGYANYIRKEFSASHKPLSERLLAHSEIPEQIDAMLRYTVETLEGRWEMSDEEISAVAMKTGWGVTYDLEQLLEHAIVHVLRHRRQIEKFISNGLIGYS